MFNKSIVKRNFSDAALLYDGYATFQNDVAEEVSTSLQLSTLKNGTMLDIGSGTGLLSFKLACIYPYVKIFCLDIAHGMSVQAMGKRKNSNINILTADGETLPFHDKTLDSVVSSLSLQWFKDIKKSFEEIFRVLKNNGTFFVTLLSDGSFKELKKSHNTFFHPGEYFTLFNLLPHKRDLIKILESSGFNNFNMKESTHIREHENSLALLKSLKLIGAKNPHGPEKHARGVVKMRGMLNFYDEHYKSSNGVTTTYQVLHIWGTK